MSGRKPLSVGVVTWDHDPPIGGMGRHVMSSVSGLRSAGHSVSVFSRSNLRLPFGRSILFSLLLPFVLPQWIRRHSCDVLHAHAGPGGVFLLFKPKRVPLVVTANHTYADQVRFVGGHWKRFLIPFERRTYRLADGILCISQGTAFSLMHAYGIPKEKITVVPCGIDVASFASQDLPLSSRERTCVFIGRPDRRKGFDLLQSAWPIVLQSVSDARLVAVGIGHVSLSHDALVHLLGSCRAVVCPSRLEGFGLVAAEAIAAGTPVVATDVPGLRSVVTDFETGFLTAVDPVEIAERIVALLRDDAVWERLHAGCVRRRGGFDTSIEIERHCQAYVSLLHHHGQECPLPIQNYS